MRVGELIPSCLHKVRFSHRDKNKVPAESGCYAISNCDGDILYVGQADCLRERVKSHLKDPSKTAATKLGVAFWLHYKVASPKSVNGIELGWYRQHEDIEGHRPILNRQRPPSG